MAMGAPSAGAVVAATAAVVFQHLVSAQALHWHSQHVALSAGQSPSCQLMHLPVEEHHLLLTNIPEAASHSSHVVALA